MSINISTTTTTTTTTSNSDNDNTNNSCARAKKKAGRPSQKEKPAAPPRTFRGLVMGMYDNATDTSMYLYDVIIMICLYVPLIHLYVLW